ncbi:MAG: antitoxin [Rubrobacter sp.]|jgi:hypothetical protein|nr:antitoxin [Rubrobacter sp.]
MKHEKLTLRLEKTLIEAAKRHARERNTSVSKMVAAFFESLERPEIGERGPITRRLRGSLKPADGKTPTDEKDYLRHLEEKHG